MIKEASHLILEYNDQKEVIAFMGINDKKLEMLFFEKCLSKKTPKPGRFMNIRDLRHISVLN